MSKFYETLKAIFHDVEFFLTISLKDVKLPKAVVAEKESILKKLADVEEDFPQLKSVGVTNTTEQLTVTKQPPPQKSTEQAELRKKANPPSQVADRSDVSSEIYSALDDDEPETNKASSSISDVSEAASASTSVNEVMSNASHSGMLLKKNVSKSKVDIKSLLLSRGKKFCVVSAGVFYIFDKQSSKKQSSSFPLRGYEARVSADQPSKKEFLFELVNPGQKSYAFAAASQDDMQQWISILTAEAQKIPDERTSLVYEPNVANDDSSDGEDYEEPDDNPVKPVKFKPSPQLKSNIGKVVASSSPEQDEDFYDDVQAPAVVDDDEIYDDAESKAIDDSDDLIYESFDDVNEVPAAVKTNIRIVTSPSSPPLPVIARNNNAKDAKPAAVVPSPTVSRSPSSRPTTNADGLTTDYDNMFYSKWNCRADGDNELTFKHGDIILVMSREYDHFGWWVGKLNGKVGLVPREYLTPAYELVSDRTVQ